MGPRERQEQSKFKKELIALYDAATASLLTNFHFLLWLADPTPSSSRGAQPSLSKQAKCSLQLQGFAYGQV
ncbi:hypothetical protein EJ06DRAFT_534801 [Trichodelitschia bisporula]|uniref:Uncharacterized protein n=1 Tax=Trichodelitschia bisporula TaxID=703511 RepID=A0A6G1HI47_9PEZI|nr:hypothetical protein EJ06DRAFT_534801 [Trichodelitschia bisporula]